MYRFEAVPQEHCFIQSQGTDGFAFNGEVTFTEPEACIGSKVVQHTLEPRL
jgi:hypothetical protein